MNELSEAQPAEADTCGVPDPAAAADQLAQDREDWLTLRAALAHLVASYKPVDARGWPAEIHVDSKVLTQAMGTMRAGGRLPPEQATLETAAKAYGAWQEQVTWAEAENCSRLVGLVWCAQKSEDIAERRQNSDVRMMGVLFRKSLRDWYRVDSWPTEYAELRDWAQQKTRRYDAMARDWRGL